MADGAHDARVEAGARRARVDAVRPEQRGTGRDGRVPVGQFGVRAVPGRGGERRIDRVLPGLRAERADPDEGEGAAGVDRDALLTRSPLATWRSSPLGAAAAGGRATP